MPQQIAVENINVPGLTTNVNAEKNLAIRKALLKVLPALSPGMTHLPEAVFPGGATSGW